MAPGSNLGAWLALLPSACFYAGSILALYVLSLSIYRVYFHPLAKYPGPVLAKITSWYDFHYLINGDRTVELWRQHEIYGPVVRYRPNSLSFSTPGALQDIYALRKPNIIKSDWYSFIINASHGQINTHTVLDRDRHAIRRRLISHAFSDNALRSMEEPILSNVKRWCSLIAGSKQDRDGGGWSKPVNMATWANYLIFDIIALLAFGRSFDLTTREDNRYVLHLMSQRLKLIYTAGYAPYRALLAVIVRIQWLNDLIGGETARDDQKMIKFANEALAERLQREKEPQGHEQVVDNDGVVQRDIFHYLLRGKDPETGAAFSRTELASESELLLIAGGDTTAAVVSALFFYLLHNPRTLDRLVAEIRSHFSTLEEVRPATLKSASLPYLRACLDETMRVSAPVGGPLTRKILPGGAVIDGEFYPEHTEVAVTTYVVHHREETFPDRFAFRPERWIVDPAKDVTEQDVAAAQAAFAPFSLGPRGCVGKNLAYAELHTIVARLLWEFDVKLVEDPHEKVSGSEGRGKGKGKGSWGTNRKGEYPTKDFFIGERDGPIVAFKARTN